MKLYQLLPAVIRFFDAASSADEPAFEKIVYLLEQEGGVTEQDIKGLTDLTNPDLCPVIYLVNLSFLQGGKYINTWSDGRKRLFVRSLALLNKMRGQKQGIDVVLNLIDQTSVQVQDLWKASIYELFDYSLTQDYVHPYRAARVAWVAK